MEAVLKALANRRRLRMLSILARRGEVHVGALADELGLSVKTASRNLRLLERAGLVASEPQGPYVYYALNPGVPRFAQQAIDELQSIVRSVYSVKQ